MLVSVASNLTLLTKEHFVPRKISKIFPRTKPVLCIYTDRNTAKPTFRNETRWAISQTSSISWSRESQSNNNLLPTIDESYTLRFVLQACSRMDLWLKFAEIPGFVLIPWQHNVTVLPCGSASAAYYIHTLITPHLRERKAGSPYYSSDF